MVGGTGIAELSREARQDFKSIVGLAMLSNTSQSYGGATHIGDGKLLTAYHVVAAKDFSMELYTVEGQPLGSVEKKDLIIKKPKSEAYFNLSNGKKLSSPDLAIIILPKAIRNKIKNLPVMKISLADISAKDKALLVAQGSEDFNNGGRIGHFKMGNVYTTSTTKHHIESGWIPEQNIVALVPGDSGSPLVKITDDKLLLVGVASISQSFPDINGEVKKARGYFTRVNTSYVKKWLKNEKALPNNQHSCSKALSEK